MKLLVVLALVEILVCGAVARADDAAAQDSNLMLRAWQCEQYAYYAKDEKQAERLFNLGYSAGQRFMKAAKDGKITAEDLHSVVPMAVSMTMSGPDEEFVLGRLFEMVSTDVGDELMKKDLDGTPLELGKWITDDELLKGRGDLKFDSANCGLLK